jgi:hypothetical protein
MKYIDRFVRKYPRFGIPNLIIHITLISGIVALLQFILPYPIVNLLTLNSAAILQGFQLWRLVTFIFVLDQGNLFMTLLIIYIMYSFGKDVSQVMGDGKFTLYILAGMIATIIVSFIFPGEYSGAFIDLTLLIAFGSYFPDASILLMFVLPLKAKYLMYFYLGFDLLSMLQSLFMGNWAGVFSILASLAGPILFFGPDIIHNIKALIRRIKYKRKFK